MTLAAADASRAPSGGPGRSLRDYLALTKPRITLLVLATAAAGFYVASPGSLDVMLLAHTLLGTALVAAGTSAMNQVLERDVDGRMVRTRNRPLPAGRLPVGRAALFAGLLAAAGVGYLGAQVNLLTAGLAAASFLIYDLVYTPLKRVHSLSTLVGAIPGALPAMGGWTAARGELGPGAWALFAILFFWQLPHFLALAWLLREDYGRAGLAMLSVGDREGRRTRHQALLYTLTLLPVSLLPATLGLAGGVYAAAALLLGGLFLLRATGFFRRADAGRARRLFRFSLAYLPLLLAAMMADKRAGVVPKPPAAPGVAVEAPVQGVAAAGGLVAMEGRGMGQRP